MEFPTYMPLTDTLCVTINGIDENTNIADIKINNVGDEKYSMHEVYNMLSQKLGLPKDSELVPRSWACDICNRTYDYSTFRHNCMKCVYTDICVDCWNNEEIDGLCPHIETRDNDYRYTDELPI